ncbi:MAG TPA: UvrD-helicase domain-containing protein [Thermoanaerobaculia bacterium]|nr:UvrD-helicase domain-containing protein [Thermoanaerobaculia bacterium]
MSGDIGVGARVRAELERQLNPDQVAAVTHGEGPQLVLAGAGSGKTRVITYRIYWLAEERGVDPGTIVAVTFTNKAAAEMRERVEDLLGVHPLRASVGTFHRYALVLLRRYGERVGLKRDFAIHDATDQLTLVKEALAAEGLSETAFSPRSVLAQISAAKNRLLEPAAYESRAQDFFERKVAAVYRRYQGLLHQASGVDFDDLIAQAVKLLATDAEIGARVRARTRYLLVDEYQDTNHAQLRLIEELAGKAGNLTAVGDEDQGIYRWRGADLDNILRFEESFPGAVVRKLERNYRSTQTILDVSGALIAHNVGRRGKRLWTDRGAGAKVELYRAGDEGEEAHWVVATLERLRSRIKLSEMGVLVRTNAQTRALEDEMLKREMPYVLVGGVRFYDRAEIKDLVAYLRVLRNPRDNFSLARIFNQPPRGIGKATLELLRDQALQLGQPLWDLLYLDELGGLPARSAAALRRFRDLIVGLQEAAAELPLPALLDRLLEATGYEDLYRRDDPEDLARLENIREFLSAAQEFTESNSYNGDDADLLTAFLDHVSLVTDLDTYQSERGISLMTLHSAKGLEFRAVVVSGLEEGVLPHFNSQGKLENVEEERRLFYVGMTRARELLYLTCCRRRRVAGRYQDQLDSTFLAELPPALLAVSQSPGLFREPAARFDARAQGVYSFFGGGRSGGAAGAEEEHGGRAAAAAAPQRPGALGGGARAAPTAPTGAMATRERTVVRDADAAPLARPSRPLRRGSRVRHPTLGQGVVLELDGQGEEAKITVFFERHGKRKLIARYANLEML